MEQHFSIFEVEKVSGVSREFLRRRIVDGRIRAVRVGRFWRIPLSEVKRLLSGELGINPSYVHIPVVETAMLTPAAETR
jgi:excisionase family DNA binding protein